jgi:signal transduction histidine kinase
MKWLLAFSAALLFALAPAPARPWLGSLGLVAWLAGRIRPRPGEDQRLVEVQARAEGELVRRAVLEEEGLRTSRLVGALKQANSLEQCLEAIMQGLHSSLQADAYGLYSQGRLLAAYGQAPVSPPRLGAGICQRDGQVVVPMPGGLLWLQRQRGEFQDFELNLLESLVGPASLGLGLWSRQQALQHWSDCLVNLVEGARSLIGSQDPQRVAEQMERLVRLNLPHELGMICGLGPVPSLERSWPQPFQPNWQALPASPRGAFVSEGLVAGVKNWLAAPLHFEGGPAGLLLVANPEGWEFQPEQATLLAMIAALGAGAMAQTHLYADLRLTHEELQASQVKQVQSSKLAAVGQLAAGMAHELNSPLGAIVLSLEGAQKHLLSKPEVALKRLDTACMGVRQCQHLVESLLLYCRNQPLEFKTLDLYEVVAETLLLTRGEFQQSDVELVVELEGTAPIHGNAGQLRQVLTNLLVNARDAVLAPQAQARRVTVSSHWDQGRVQLRVQDQGAGMSEDVLARACEPFFTTKPVGRGTGLGLSLCHEIVQQHGGQLNLSSQLGIGTCVEVSFPLV